MGYTPHTISLKNYHKKIDQKRLGQAIKCQVHMLLYRSVLAALLKFEDFSAKLSHFSDI
jgi:hypothetical protein